MRYKLQAPEAPLPHRAATTKRSNAALRCCLDVPAVSSLRARLTARERACATHTSVHAQAGYQAVNVRSGQRAPWQAAGPRQLPVPAPRSQRLAMAAQARRPPYLPSQQGSGDAQCRAAQKQPLRSAYIHKQRLGSTQARRRVETGFK